MKRFLFFLLLITTVNVQSQDFSFSQFYEKPLLRNPSLAGVFDGDIRISGIFRNQWQSVTVPFQTSAASAEVKFPIGGANDYLTAGLQMTNDVAGDVKLKRTQLLPVLNFHKSLNEEYDSYLSLAFMAGSVNSQFDATKLQLDDQFQNGAFNPNNPTQQVFKNTSVNYMDLSAGITYSMGFGEMNANTFYVGASMFHLNKAKVGFYANNETTTLQQKFTLNTGLTTQTSDYNRIVCFVDYYKQGGNNQVMGGALYGWDLMEHYDTNEKITLYAGAFYRWKDALVPVVKLNLYRLNIGLSYDVNTSQLKTASQLRGGFEASISYYAKLRIRNEGAEKMRCVKFVF